MAVKASVKVDPALERWNKMREDVYKHFQWTNRTARIGFVGMVLVPGALYYLATSADMRFQWRGTRKGEALTVSSKAEADMSA